VKRYVLFHDKRHPKEMGRPNSRPSYLALAREVAASMQNQAKSALLLWYKEVLQVDLPLAGQYHQGQGAATASGGAHAK
jgi:hypothetical protein